METHGKPWKTHGKPMETRGKPWKWWALADEFHWISSGAILGCQVWEYSHSMSQLRVTLLGFYIGFGSGWADLGWLGWLRVWLWSVGNRILHDIFPWFFTIFTHFHPFSLIFINFPLCSWLVDLFFRFAKPSFMSLTSWFVAPFLVAVSFVIPGLKAFNSTRRVPRSNQRFKDYTAVLRAVLLKLAQAVLEARISGGSREK